MHLEGGSLMDAAEWPGEQSCNEDVGVSQKLNYSDVATTTQYRARERYYGTIRKIHSKSGFAIAFPQPNDYV